MASTLTKRNADISFQAMTLGAVDYIPKPSSAKDLNVGEGFRAELLDKVDLMVRFLFDRHPTFAVPTSLLLDPQGRLAAIYRGPVDAERLLRDVAALDLPAADRRRLGEPMPGRRYGPHMALQLDDLARRFSGRYQEDHLRFLRLAADEADAMAAQLDPTQLPEAQRQSLLTSREALGRLHGEAWQLRLAFVVALGRGADAEGPAKLARGARSLSSSALAQPVHVTAHVVLFFALAVAVFGPLACLRLFSGGRVRRP